MRGGGQLWVHQHRASTTPAALTCGFRGVTEGKQQLAMCQKVHSVAESLARLMCTCTKKPGMGSALPYWPLSCR